MIIATLIAVSFLALSIRAYRVMGRAEQRIAAGDTTVSTKHNTTMFALYFAVFLFTVLFMAGTADFQLFA